jgi:hypothetical protein
MLINERYILKIYANFNIYDITNLNNLIYYFFL